MEIVSSGPWGQKEEDSCISSPLLSLELGTGRQEVDGGAQCMDAAFFMECKSLLWMNLSVMGQENVEVRNMFCWFLNGRRDPLDGRCLKGTACWNAGHFIFSQCQWPWSELKSFDYWFFGNPFILPITPLKLGFVSQPLIALLCQILFDGKSIPVFLLLLFQGNLPFLQLIPLIFIALAGRILS